MAYQLHRLAAGNYDLLWEGVVIGSVVRSTTTKSRPITWRAELADGWQDWPAPFSAAEHEFASLEDLADWLGASLIVDKPFKRQ